jgi:hypothetical protein
MDHKEAVLHQNACLGPASSSEKEEVSHETNSTSFWNSLKHCAPDEVSAGTNAPPPPPHASVSSPESSIAEAAAVVRSFNVETRSWHQKDYDLLQSLLSSVDASSPIDWASIGLQLTPTRSGKACQHAANHNSTYPTSAIPKNKKRSTPAPVVDRKLSAAGFSWIEKDLQTLQTLLSDLTETPIDWIKIGESMVPQRSAASCKSQASKKGMQYPTGLTKRMDAEGRTLSGNAWNWIDKDYSNLRLLVKECPEAPVDWHSIGLRLVPQRTATVCKAAANKRGIPYPTASKLDDDGRKLGGMGWSWVQKDYDHLETLIASGKNDSVGTEVDWVEIGKAMNPVRAAKVCKVVAGQQGFNSWEAKKASNKRTDEDGRKLGGTGWSWVEKDWIELERLLSAPSKGSDDKVDWNEIGRNMNPQRGAATCKFMAHKRGIPYSTRGSYMVGGEERKLVGASWSWVTKDYDDLKRLLDEDGGNGESTKVNWNTIGQQMNPVRGANACRCKAVERGMMDSSANGGGGSSNLIKVDEDGRKLGGAGWTWVQKDYDNLQQLIDDEGTDELGKVDWPSIGGKMKPLRGGDTCRQRNAAVKRKIDEDHSMANSPENKKPREI